MEKLQLIDFDTAKQLKTLGFPQDYSDAIYCICDWYFPDGDYTLRHKVGTLIYNSDRFSNGDWVSAPSMELVKNWLIDKYDYYIEVVPAFILKEDNIGFSKWTFIIHTLNEKTVKEMTEDVKRKTQHDYFSTYNEALHNGIIETLKKIK